MSDKERFIEICKSIKREGIEDLMDWLEKGDFYTAPASARYHGSFDGGLLKHSLSVYDHMKRVLNTYPEIECSEESAAIVSLFHDFCKIGLYKKTKRNRKTDDGKWEQYDGYEYDEKFKFGSHGGKSVFLIHHFIELTPEEGAAINCHMGAFDNDKVGATYEQFRLAWALHVADEASTYIDAV